MCLKESFQSPNIEYLINLTPEIKMAQEMMVLKHYMLT